MQYKKPESVLVVIYATDIKKVLMLQRNDDPLFWQSVTGSLEEGEQPYQTAVREVKEETGIDIIAEQLDLIDAHHSIMFEIFPQFRHRYAPNIQFNQEHWFYLPLSTTHCIHLTEHSDYQWLSYAEAAALTKSDNNRDAILCLSESA